MWAVIGALSTDANGTENNLDMNEHNDSHSGVHQDNREDAQDHDKDNRASHNISPSDGLKVFSSLTEEVQYFLSKIKLG
jgi:hypothetical protein